MAVIIDVNKLSNDLKDLLEIETKDFVKKIDQEFLKKLGASIAKETARLYKGGIEAATAETNLKHLKAQLKTEIAKSRLVLQNQSQDAFEKALKIIISAIIVAVKAAI